MALDIYGTEDARRMLLSIRRNTRGMLRIARGISLAAAAEQGSVDRDLSLLLEGVNTTLQAAADVFGVAVQPITMEDLDEIPQSPRRQTVARGAGPLRLAATSETELCALDDLPTFDVQAFNHYNATVCGRRSR